jgi:hypothetical protein
MPKPQSIIPKFTFTKLSFTKYKSTKPKPTKSSATKPHPLANPSAKLPVNFTASPDYRVAHGIEMIDSPKQKQVRHMVLLIALMTGAFNMKPGAERKVVIVLPQFENYIYKPFYNSETTRVYQIRDFENARWVRTSNELLLCHGREIICTFPER